MNLSMLPLLLASNKYRIIDVDLPKIFNLPANLWIVSGLVLLSIVLGVLFANAVRMKDYGWKVSLILATLLVSVYVVLFGEFKLGVDLKGGVILVYAVDKDATKALNVRGRDDEWDMGQLMAVLGRRLNPEGLKEIVIRPFGPDQVEIVVPETDPLEVERLKELIRTGGVLQFMIVAGETDGDLLDRARAQAERRDQRLRPDVVDDNGDRVGYWAHLGREDGDPKTSAFRELGTIENAIMRDAATGEIIDLSPGQRGQFAGNDALFRSFLEERGTRNVDVLMVYDQDFTVRGEDLAVAHSSMDQSMRPSVDFTMKSGGDVKMGFLTGNNIQRKMAIIFDNVVLSAPVIQSKISSQGEITGNFTREKVDSIVGILRSGSMPVVMQKQPISENQIGAILGRDTVEQASRSVLIALGLVFAFMAMYYRLSGVIACFALALNLLLTIMIMVAFQAPLTLPGIAGLVLTVAMSVDANVLISERIKEELARGAALRMAIRNGFDKALTAIIDGNLTTLLVSVVLFFMGTDQVKGFGITLMLGNITSMYTAIFVVRVILDIAERTRWVKTLRMGNIMARPQVDWVRYLLPAAAGSVLLILIGIGATAARGKGLFDIDLAGGTSVTFLLEEPTPETKVRERLDKVFATVVNPETKARVDHNVYGMTVETQKPDTVYKVDSSLEDVDLLKEKVREALRKENGEDGLRSFVMEIGTLTEKPIEQPKARPVLGTPASADPASGEKAKVDEKATPPADDKSKEDPKIGEAPPAKADEKAEAAKSETEKKAEPAKSDSDKKDGNEGEGDGCETQAAPEEAPKSGTAPPAASPAPSAEPAKAADPVPAEPAIGAPAVPPTTTPVPSNRPTVETTGVIKFPGSPLGAPAIKQRISATAREVINQDVDVFVTNPAWDGMDNSTFEEWTVTLPVEKAKAEAILAATKTQLEKEIVWQTSSKIGGQVSADTRWRAIGALVVSMLGIVAYVWFRFQRVAWGLAAVAALAHDALVMLTSIALSYWLVGALGFAGVEEFKISLPVVAAFLTILGYSVNDTIVIFDRLREIRGKSPLITRQMLNDAVNLTLGRTVILAGITLTTVLILYGFGGPGIHAFAFALVTGVISGCYSTLAIASPILLWLLNPKAFELPQRTTGDTRDPAKPIASSSANLSR